MFDIYEKVKEYNSVAIAAHVRPDGDAIGSCLGLYFYLKKRMPQKNIKVLLEKTDECFSVIPGITEIVNDYDDNMSPEAFIILDAEPSRIGDFAKLYEKALFTINIDHHKSNKGNLCDIEYIVPEASSASELVYKLMDKDFLDENISQCIYMGIAHDTGIFRFSNVSSDTMKIVSELLEYNFNFSKLLDVTYFEKTYLQNIIQANVVCSSKLYLENKLIIGIAEYDLIKSYNAEKSDFDGCVNQLLLTKGVEAAIFIFEKPPGNYKCSMRACSDLIDVSKICEVFGGGGHVRASGCEYSGDLQKFICEVLKYVGEQING